MSTIQEFHPYSFTIFRVERIKIAKFLCFFKASSPFEMNQYFLELSISKSSTSEFSQLLLIVYFKLFLEISFHVSFFVYMNIFIVH